MPEAPRPWHLRHAIDRGRTGDKVSHNDPAAAPLGTDEEAAGTPVPAEAVAKALRNEIRGPPLSPREGSEPAFWPGAVWILAGGVLLGGAAWFVFT